MSFKKLALVTAMFAATSGAYAMEAMDDESMAAATGQDGVTIGITTNALTLDQIIHDRDGYNTADSGAIVIDNMVVDTLGGEIVLQIDADGNSAGNAFLNINVNLSAGLQIQTGDLRVANSLNTLSADPDGAGPRQAEVTTWGGVDEQSGVIMQSQTITLGATTLNIQLGNEVQTYTMGATTKTAMILLNNTSMTGGLTVGTWAAGTGYTGGLTLNDANGGSISVGRMSLRDAGGANLTLGTVGVNVENNGLVIDIASIGDVDTDGAGPDTANGLYQSMERVALGNPTLAGNGYLGDIEVTGLQLSGTSIRISGH